MERRLFLRWMTAVTALGLSPRLASTLLAQAETLARFVAPPGEETREIAAAIDQVIAALKSGTSPSAILSDPKYMPLHPWARFRAAIRDHATHGVLTLVTPEEPGTRLTLKGTVLDPGGSAVAKARVYLYQTSAKGWYSDQAAHVSGNSGDQKHARLFGYVVTDDQGRFEVKTIRPAGYPQSTLPAHIHVEVRSGTEDGRALITEVQFSDDPRLTPEARQRSERERFLICDVKRGPDGEEVAAVLRTRG
jgi:hypothetical protein